MLLVANLAVMVKTAQEDIKDKLTELVKKCRHKKATEAQNAKREAQEAAQKQLESNTVDGVIAPILKPRATDVVSDVD